MGILNSLFGKKSARSDRGPQEVSQVRYRLEPYESEEGRGFVVETSDGLRLQWRSLPVGDGIQSLSVVGTQYHPTPLQDPAFDPGTPVCLVPERDNPHDPNSIGVWDRDRSMQVGYVPAADAARLRREFQKGRKYRCMVMWETTAGADGERVGLRILLVAEGAKLDFGLDGFPWSPA
jgi:hypothetical protein